MNRAKHHIRSQRIQKENYVNEFFELFIESK